MRVKHIKYKSNLWCTIYTCFVLFYFQSHLIAQDPVIFLDRSDLLPTLSVRPNLSTALGDINGDFRDDIIQFNDNQELLFHIQVDDGTSFLTHGPTAYPLDKIPTTMLIGDIDNSGVNDLLSAGFYNGISIINGQTGIDPPIIADNLDIELFAQGSSLMDVNNDGWLDVMLSHDDGANILLLNDGTGQLIQSDLIDFNTVPVSDNSGNYSSIWFDADSDDDLDLYVAKCRVGVDDPTDPRRINALYINDNGTFREGASIYGLALGDQSWAVDSGDLDNDGDIDLVIINHGAPHIIMEQRSDTFIRHELSHLSQPIITEDLQVSMADFNNDGLQDVLIAGIDDYLLLNQGNFEFFVDTNPFGTKRAATFALGDVNEDGYTDAYIGFLSPRDELWINNGDINNYVKFSLKGLYSNRSGIGSKVSVYTPTGNYVKWLNSGVSYGITNSLNVCFGIGSEMSIDSIVCLWPSGVRDTYYDVNINEHYLITESLCMEPLNRIITDDLTIDCSEDEINLISTRTYDVEWNTGELSDLISVSGSGYYYASIVDECRNISQIINVSEEISQKPILSQSGVISICNDMTLELSHDLGGELSWSNGEIDETIDITESGVYYAFQDEDCIEFYSDTLVVEVIEFEAESILEVFNAVLIDTTLSTDFGDVIWFSDKEGMMVITKNDSLSIDRIESDTTIYFSQIKQSISDTIIDCYSEVFAYEIIIDTTSSTGDEVANSIKIYPNPVDKTIQVSSDFDIDNIAIFNVSGQSMITNINLSNRNFSLDVGGWYSGLYVVWLHVKGRYYYRKFIKI